MDREIYHIWNILSNSSQPLTTSDISKEIFNKHGIKISKKIIQNYLWSYFRNEINYLPETYMYTLKKESTIYESSQDFEVKKISNSPRAISITAEGSKLNIEYDETLQLETLLQALGVLYLKGLNNKHDLFKNVNRVIDSL